MSPLWRCSQPAPPLLSRGAMQPTRAPPVERGSSGGQMARGFIAFTVGFENT